MPGTSSISHSSPNGSFVFFAETQRADIAVAFFAKSSAYFPVSQPAMLNFQVDDLDGVCRDSSLRAQRAMQSAKNTNMENSVVSDRGQSS